MYTFEQLKEDVRKEAEALRIHATVEELSRLNDSLLRPSYIDRCIYGLMTGHCFSDRAHELIGKSAVRYIKDGDISYVARDGFERIKQYANGATIDDLDHARKLSHDTHYSAIEAYILLPEANNANLIAYLRGEADNLEL